MNVAIYSRVSTKGRDQDCENQTSQMREWAAREGHTVVAIYEDEVSGSGKVRRPEFEKMMSAAHAKKFDMLLFWSLDRLSREGVWETLSHLRKLDDAGVCWRSSTEAYLDSCGVFREAVLAILAAIAKQERIRISERVKAGLEIARAAGRIGGRRPVEHDPAVIEKLMEWREHGYSVTQISQLINIQFNVEMSKSTVHRIVSRAEVA